MASQCGPWATGEEKKRRKQNWKQKGFKPLNWISKLKIKWKSKNELDSARNYTQKVFEFVW